MLHRLTRPALAAAFALLAVAPAAAVAPFNFDTTPGRLPKTVVPTDYRISLTPNPTAKTLHGTEKARTTSASATRVSTARTSRR